MDPFSIAIGAATLLHVSRRLIEVIRKVKKGAASIDKDLEALSQDASAILSATMIIENLEESQLKYKKSLDDFEQPEFFHVWECIRTLLPRCEEAITSILNLLHEVEVVSWSRTPKRFDGFIKFIKNHSREDEYLSLRRTLSGYQATLQMLLSAIQISSVWKGLASQDDIADDINIRFAELNERIDTFRPVLESKSGSTLRGAFNSARTVASLASRNQYFDVPQPVSSIFTGRQTMLQDLEKIMFEETLESNTRATNILQKRFVIYGLGGSGKTQFCCKFAQDNRQKFWAIFWVDASSEDSIRQTFAKIGSIARVEPNDRAAKHWLSVLEKPWLLIVDNANDNQIELDKHFPSGERGHLLITTTNPSHRIYGTVGGKYFDFSTLETQDATSLLLKAANEPFPWTNSSEEAASQITRTLGYLPLALIVAGKTIVKGLCTLGNYLSFYESSWKKIRNQVSRKDHSKPLLTDRNPHKIIYVSCEMMHRSLQMENTQASSDAIGLLNIFSFLHRESIPFVLFLQGAINPKAEAEEEKKNMTQEKNQQMPSWKVFDILSAVKA